jgi:L-ascorbate metabolism protein UlaG (beta-lactamase superfamily)
VGDRRSLRADQRPRLLPHEGGHRRQNTDYREAAHLAEELDVGLVVPTHYDLFAFNAEDPGYFVSYLFNLNHERRHKILRPGELLHFVRESS